MTIPEHHLQYMGSLEAYQGRPQDWLRQFLQDGITAPEPQIYEPQWSMPGQSITADMMNQGTKGPYARNNPFLIVGIAPDYEDYRRRMHLSSPCGKIFRTALRDAGFKNDDVYYTTVIRFPRPKNATSFKQCWLRSGWQYLQEEIEILQPSGILFLGGELVKMAFGAKATLENVRRSEERRVGKECTG